MQNQNEQRWLDLLRLMGARDTQKIQGVYNDLMARYAEPHRAYHTLNHIEHCLCELNQLTFNCSTIEVELAIWYHDAIYDTRNKDNEEKSAALAAGAMKGLGLAGKHIDLVVELILATKHSASPVFNQKAWLRTRLIADIDLSIFGQSEKKFDEYERQIRKEYEWISEDDFVVGRSAILKSFLDRPKIYLTQILRTKYEVQARRNISRSIDNRR